MNYSKHKSFGESNKDQEIDFNQYETNSEIDCYLNLSFRENSFVEEKLLNKFIKKIKNNTEKYFPEGSLNIVKDNRWVNINLNFTFENEKDIEFEQISNYSKYITSMNAYLEKISKNSLEGLINETIVNNPKTDYKQYADEIKQYIGSESEFEEFERTHIPIVEEYLGKQTDYLKRLKDLLDKDRLKEFHDLGKEYDEFLKNDFKPEEKNNTYIDRTLEYTIIKSDQRELLNMISKDELGNIAPKHHSALPGIISELLEDYINKNEYQTEKKKQLLYSAISKNLINIIKEYEDIANRDYLE